jgi:hypothetical protein
MSILTFGRYSVYTSTRKGIAGEKYSFQFSMLRGSKAIITILERFFLLLLFFIFFLIAHICDETNQYR